MYTPAVPGPSASTSAGPAAAAPTEVVTRPDPGLARGVWESKPALFYGAGALVVLGAAIYAMARAGLFRRRVKTGRP